MNMLKKAWTSLGALIWKITQKARKCRIIDLLYIHLLEPILQKKNIWNRSLKWYEIVSMEDYCKENEESCIEIEPACKRLVYESSFFELSEEKEYFFKTPSIYVAILHDVTAIGSTGLVVAGEKVLFDACERDKNNRMDFRYGPLKRKDNNRILVEMNRKKMEIDNAINMCGFAPSNYYHFTMEILSRLEYVNSLQISEEIPLLIDEEIKVYPQLQQLLEVVNVKRVVVYIPQGVRCKVRELVCPSMNSWMPINVKSRELFRMSDNLFAESGVNNIRAKSNAYMIEQTEKKIYISRKNAQLPRIANEENIIPLFADAGFEIVYAEHLSYYEQIKLFSSVKCIVGASGAALTNILYLHPGTVVGCIIPKEYDFCIYSTMAHLLGCKTLFLSPEIIFKGEYTAADYYKVDGEKCKRYIDELNRMCN